jgi:fructose-1,6-bisphosphatase I
MNSIDVHISTTRVMGDYESNELTSVLNGVMSSIKTVHSHIAIMRKEYNISHRKFTATTPGNSLIKFSDHTFLNMLKGTGIISTVSLRGARNPIILYDTKPGDLTYSCSITPLFCLGEDKNVGIYTLFSVHRNKEDMLIRSPMENLLQTGRSIVAAGLISYGDRSQYICATEQGCREFIANRVTNDFEESADAIFCPPMGGMVYHDPQVYRYYPREIRELIANLNGIDGLPMAIHAKNDEETLLVDAFRYVLLEGGFFSFPISKPDSVGLSLLHQCFPLAYIIEIAGGTATNYQKEILDILPESLDDLSSFYCGSKGFLEFDGAYYPKENRS